MRLLHIKKKESEDINSLRRRVDSNLRDLGLRGYGKIGQENIRNDGNSLYVVESAGEGGFIVEYGDPKAVYTDSSRTETVKVDFGLIPVGATGSLVQRVYSELKKQFGEDCFEVEFD